MSTSTPRTNRTEARAADVLIPLIRTAATLSVAIAPCSLGFVIIAVSEQLIRSIMVGDDPEMLVSELQSQFPTASIEVDDDHAELMETVVDLIERPDRTLDLPVDIPGADFQMRVWDALQHVPAGSVVSYTFLAEQIRAPRCATRGVPESS